MARNREPVDLLIAKGKKHLTKAEIEERKAQEVDVPFVDIEPPEYLKGKKRIEEFNHYADMLLKIGIFTELDVDILAKYILAKELYLTYTKQLEKVMKKANIVRKWAVIDELSDLCSEGGTIEDLKELLEKICRRQRGEDATTIMNLQDKAFKQCLACAKELGLTVTSRCKLVVPPPPDEDDDEL
jgi:P27 family predicted phage terminase small subunit